MEDGFGAMRRHQQYNFTADRVILRVAGRRQPFFSTSFSCCLPQHKVLCSSSLSPHIGDICGSEMTSMWKCLLWHTCVLADLLRWCQERDSGHQQYRSCQGKHQISWQEEEHADVITAGGADSALKDHGAGAAVPQVPWGRCPQCRHSIWHRCQERAEQKACLPSWWETRNTNKPHSGMLWPP